ncbi:MAG: tetratricopeptide repeat protein [Treponema sp.]|nr:tetratricopeptide repeat protein [Treponema sp.]
MPEQVERNSSTHTEQNAGIWSGNSGPQPGVPDRNSLRADYNKLLPVRMRMIQELELRIQDAVTSMSSHPRVLGRVKSFDSYFRKYIRLLKEEVSGQNPAANPPKITDTIGIRVICPFLEDLAVVEELIKASFNVLEVERKGGDHTYREFGYESIHLLIAIPDDIVSKQELSCCDTAEIQIRTILQDAWAEVEHELVYKAEFTPFDDPLKRKLAAVNATLSLADIIFQEIRSYQRELNGELGKRRDSFFRKIEESTDALLFSEENQSAGSLALDALEAAEPGREFPQPISPNVSIDELLLNALYAHNKNQFSEAIAFYTRILEMNPDKAISALIYKHRGMAYFARSHYEEAIKDFSESLALDPKSYKAAYYKGVVCSVLHRYPQAVDAFNESLEINPYQPYCLYRRGQAYYHLEDYPHALGDCEAALALEPLEAAGKFRDLVLRKFQFAG